MSNWTQSQAIALCAAIEMISPAYGAHVALTGGCLYKTGERKDCDILLYRIRQVEKIDVGGLMEELKKKLGIEVLADFGWVMKACWAQRDIDFFFPERVQEQVADGWYI